MNIELPQGRIHYFDALRGLGFLAIVIFHAAGLYIPGNRADENLIGSFIFFATDMFVMAMFFLIAGYFGALVYQKRGALEFVKDRAMRILGPLLLFVPITYAAFLYLVSLPIASRVHESGLYYLLPAKSLSIESLPLFHLWFLYLLVWYYIIALAIIFIYKHSKWVRMLCATITKHILDRSVGILVVLGVVVTITAAFFVAIPGWYAWYGVPNQTIGLVILPSVFFIFMMCFFVGWLLFINNRLLQQSNKLWKWILTFGLVAGASAYILLGVSSNPVMIEDGAYKAGIAVLYAGGLWGITLGLMGLASRVVRKGYQWIEYITKASYWTYLVHLPISFGLHMVFAHLDLPALVAIPAMVSITILICFITYEYLVRHTIIGRFINGPRKR